MAGLGIGSLLGGFLAERVKNKISLYFVVELLIGGFGVISLPFLDFLGRNTAGSSYLISFLCMFAFLCFPTFLMGITLPLLTKIFNKFVRNFLDTISLLYFVNTIGAAFGALLASYIFITFFGLDSAVYIAVTTNFILAALILLSKYLLTGHQEQESEEIAQPQFNREHILGKVAYLLVFITGFLAIGYEIVWFRVVSVLVKASPYAFSTTLSVYLLGIALGSFYMSKYLKRHTKIDKKSLFFFLQSLIGITVLITFIGYFYLTEYTFLEIFTRVSFDKILHPPYHIEPLTPGVLFLLFDIVLWPMLFVFVPTFFMGASFPLIAFLALSHPNKEGQLIGTVYFFNIVGNVFGGIVTGFLLLPLLGTESTILLFASVGILLGIFAFNLSGKPFPIVQRIGFALIILATTLFVFPSQSQLYQSMHSPSKRMQSDSKEDGKTIITHFEEGRDGVIVTYQHNDKLRNYINGLPHGSRGYYFGHQVEVIEATSFAPKVENVLVIGFGGGDGAKTVLKMEDVRKVTIVELNHTLMKNLKKLPTIREDLSDPRVNLIIDDGRRFLLRTKEEYDLILIDPIRTATSYSNNLYSYQFFEIISRHLARGGVFMAWLSEHHVLPKTILSVFNYVRMYKFFCLASNSPFKKDDERQERLIAAFLPQEQQEFLNLKADYKGDLYLGNEDYVKTLTAGFPINQDWKPVTEYYLGLQSWKRWWDLASESPGPSAPQ
jgi:predicted membrane-bound spermidine synthase